MAAASWKKVLLSGSAIEVTQVTASSGIIVGSNQIITTSPSTTVLSGSFSGSFSGSGAGLTGVTATPTFPTSVITGLISTDKFFVNDDPSGNSTSNNRQITYGNLLVDLAGTNLVTESNDSLTLASIITGLTSVSATSFTGSLSGNATTASNVNVTDVNTSGNQYITFVGQAGTDNIEIDTGGLAYNPGTNTLTLTGTASISSNLTVGGDLTVNGTTTTINTQNVLVSDRFVLLASGSTGNADGGIIIQNNANGQGYGLYYDQSFARWAVSENIPHNVGADTATPTYFVGFVSSSATSPVTNPSYATVAPIGTMHIDTTNNEIWIWA